MSREGSEGEASAPAPALSLSAASHDESSEGEAAATLVGASAIKSHERGGAKGGERHASLPLEFPVVIPLSTSSSGEGSPCVGTLRACKGCQKAKTACSPDQRPCSRCIRLKMVCDSDQPPVKTACTNCRRAKVKCLFEMGVTCTRCSRLGIECSPHIPGKRKRLGPTERAAAGGMRMPSGGKIQRPSSPSGATGLGSAARPSASLLQSLPGAAYQCELREARAALEALQSKGTITLNSPAAESLFGGDGTGLSPPGSSPGALSAVMTLMMVREGVPWHSTSNQDAQRPHWIEPPPPLLRDPPPHPPWTQQQQQL